MSPNTMGPKAVFLRHGAYAQLADTPSAHQITPLTEDGRVQAREAAETVREVLDGTPIHATIHTSTLLRAWQTADLLGQALGTEFVLEETDALAERNLGAANNLSLDRIDQLIAQDPRIDALPDNWKSDSRFRLPVAGAESLMQAGTRVKAYVEGVTSGAQDQAVLFVGHGAAFRHAAHLMGALAFDDIARFSMHHVAPVVFEQTADGTWRHVAGEWKVRTPALREID